MNRPIIEPDHEANGSPSVLFIDQSGQLGGAELSLLALAERYPGPCRVVLLADGPLRAKLETVGIQTMVCAMPSALARVDRGAGLTGALRRTPGSVGVIRRLARLAKSCDVVHANTQKAWVLGAVAARLARKPAVWHLRDILTADHFSRVNRTVAVRLANRLATRVIANSQATADAFVEAGGRPALTQVIWNGVAPPQASSPETTPADQVWRRAGADVPQDAPVVAVFGRLSPWKGQHVAIDAVANLPGVHLVLVGAPLFGEDDYAGQLRQQIDDAGLQDRVHMPGFCENVAELMRAADVVLHCSTAPEPFGRVLVEAMLCRRPVVAADAGGPREIMRDRYTGRLTRPSDAEHLAQTLRELLSSPDERRRLADAGYDDAMARFTLAPMVDAVTRTLTQAAARSTTEPRRAPVPPAMSAARSADSELAAR
ncbi:MAG: glycosyltransferase family 4 protein [Planctomycetota bacterium]